MYPETRLLYIRRELTILNDGTICQPRALASQLPLSRKAWCDYSNIPFVLFFSFMKKSGKQKNECAHTGSKKHGSHKFTAVETKMAVPRHSRIDESLLRPYSSTGHILAKKSNKKNA